MLPKDLTPLAVLTHSYEGRELNPPTPGDELKAAREILEKAELSDKEKKALYLYAPVDLIDQVLQRIQQPKEEFTKAVAA